MSKLLERRINYLFKEANRIGVQLRLRIIWPKPPKKAKAAPKRKKR